MLKVGIMAFQGAVDEHIVAVERAMKNLGITGKGVPVQQTLNGIDALIIPGGESTAIYNLMLKAGIVEEIQNRADDMPIMGTCAGCILLASKVSDNNMPTLDLMNFTVERNAFGRQNESFQCMLDIKGFNTPVPGIFIRAPLIHKIWGNCEELAKINQGIVMARQKNKLALVFHPELTNNVKIHQYFLEML